MSKNIIKSVFMKEKNQGKTPVKPLHIKIKEIESSFNDYDKKMIENIISLGEISVKEIMVPRIDVVLINKNSAIEEIIKIVDEKGRSRLPVYNDNIDDIVGVLHAKDLLKYFTKNRDFDLSNILREPYFVPESKIIKDLLIEFREKKIHLAIVVDEYGGMSGIVCLEDIIENIVGEIQDEFDNESEDIIKIDDNKYLIDGKTSLEDLNEALNLDIENDDIDTVGGLLYMLFGKIPSKNESIQYKNLKFSVESILDRKIKKVKLEIEELPDIEE
ncbi:MAG TPA: hemolysin family protein [Spirochaetota bacterium]|nr:MAG: Magnesium and cobalt efflux protein CorC [Spirochaetes bacterium ADurb.Bin133]HNZ26512.1 hemolysin family protein [Spirochaetota bacterium]HOF01378.1 hemolysin family protein [Spirochaetota bacterium]HOS33202.1 hemolysin family protein [Spirochaetota bacterium]HOS56283.1 hemolysin family protein [Spirochaetota bacterium]